MIKAISLWQPWATLWASGHKVYETRGWYTHHRGLIAVHAAKRWTDDEADLCFLWPFYDALKEARVEIPGILTQRLARFLPLGAIVGVVDLADCLSTGTHMATSGWVERLSDKERAFGDFSRNRWGWKAASPRLLNTPIPTRGKQGIFELPDDVEAAVMEQLKGTACSTNRP